MHEITRKLERSYILDSSKSMGVINSWLDSSFGG